MRSTLKNVFCFFFLRDSQIVMKKFIGTYYFDVKCFWITKVPCYCLTNYEEEKGREGGGVVS